MTLHSRCPVTGISIHLQGISGSMAVSHKHPITSAPLAALNGLEITGKPFAESANDYLLFCGFLCHAPVEFARALQPAMLSPRFLVQQIPQLAKLTNWLALNPRHNLRNRIPHYRITAETGEDSLAGWIAASLEITEEIGIAWTCNRQASAGFGMDWREPAGETLPRVGDSVFLEGAEKYLHRSFVDTAIVTAQVYQQIIGTVRKPKETPYSTLAMVRGLIMDYGKERSVVDYTDKQLILAKIDKAMLAKDGMMGVLARADKAAASDNFTFVEPAKPGIETPTSEPKKEDYPNIAAYIVALNKWKTRK